jgi:uncharacterized protein with beta-barrel porin domain
MFNPNARSGMSALAISLGQKMLRGGRLAKRSGQVVSYSPHVAELFGSASRAAMVVGGVILAPVAFAIPATTGVELTATGTDAIEYTLPEGATAEGENYGLYAFHGGTGPTTLVNDGIAIGTNAIISIVGDGASSSITNNGRADGIYSGIGIYRVDGNGASTIINDGTVTATGSIGDGISVYHAGEGSNVGGPITVRNAAMLESNGKGIRIFQTGDGTVEAANTGSYGVFSTGDAISVDHRGQGNILIQNDALLVSTGDGAGIQVVRSDSGGDATRIEHNAPAEGVAQPLAPFSGIRTNNGAGILVTHHSGGNIDIVTGAGSKIDATGSGVVATLAGNGTLKADLNGDIAATVDAVRIAHNGNGLVDVTVGATATLTSSQYGLAIGRDNELATGDTNVVLASGSTIANQYYGLELLTSAAGEVTLDVSGTVLVGTRDDDLPGLFRDGGCGGIYVTHYNDGGIDASVSGLIDTYGHGIGLYLSGVGGDKYYATENVGDLKLAIARTGQIIASIDGVNSFHYRDGIFSLQSAGSILSGNNGINAGHFGAGDFLIDHSGSIDAAAFGIKAFGGNDGAFSITNSGTISAMDSYETGIWAKRSVAGDTVINNKVGGLITGFDLGIYVDQAVHGDVFVTNDGQIAGRLVNSGPDEFRDGSGILVETALGGNVDIRNSGSIDVGFVGVAVGHDGAGDIVVSNTGQITAGFNSLDVSREGAGALSISNSGSLTSGRNGIYAYHRGSGALTVTNSGSVVFEPGLIMLTSMSQPSGMAAYRSEDGDINLANAAGGLIQGFDIGISSYQNAVGSAFVSNAGTIIGSTYDVDGVTRFSGIGIDAVHSGTGQIDVQNSGTISNVDTGLYVTHHAEGDISLRNSGNITAEHGIVALHPSPAPSGNISVNSSGNIVATQGRAIAVGVSGGAISITANNAATTGDTAAIYALNISDLGIDITTTGLVEGRNSAIAATANGGSINLVIASGSQVQNAARNGSTLAVIAGSTGAVPTSIRLINNGLLTGTVDFASTTANDSVSFTNNGIWNNQYGSNLFGAGHDDLIINGIWNAAGSHSNFDVDTTGGADSVFVAANGTLNFAGNNELAGGRATSFFGLENLSVAGRLSSVNNVIGDVLYTDGEVVFRAGSTLAVETGANGLTDSIVAQGVVEIQGGTLEVTYLGAGAAVIGSRHIIIEADDVIGSFDNQSIMNSAFLGWAIDYNRADGTVGLTYTQQRDLRAAALTANQYSVAGAVEALGSANALRMAAINLDNDAQAQSAFNTLNGEIHPAARTALMESSRQQRNAVLNRLQDTQGGAIWGETFLSTGSSDGQNSGNTAKLGRESWGFMAGVDVPLGEDAVLGVAGSYSNTDLTQHERSATGKTDAIHALAYVGGTTGQIRYKAGVGYAWGNVETSRTASVGTFSDRLTADYDARLFQGFAELGMALPLGGGVIEPIASITYLHSKSEAFNETGGIAALKANSESDSNTVTTLGSRFATPKSGAFSVSGMLGWQHSFGTLAPTNRFSLSGGDSFSVAGVARSRDAMAASLAGHADLSANTSIGIGYDGVIGSASHDHAGKISLRVKF